MSRGTLRFYAAEVITITAARCGLLRFRAAVPIDLAVGLLYGYPACCVLAFVADRLRGIEGVARHRSESLGVPWRGYAFHREPGPAYVRCPKCFVRVLRREVARPPGGQVL